MRKISAVLILIFTLAISVTMAQIQSADKKIATAKVKSLDGKFISTDSIENGDKPMIISFWATWCKPCVAELTAINDEYKDWQSETGVKLVAISIDDARTMNSVAPFVNGKNWDYEVYLDPNSEFRRSMNVNMVPHTFLVNGKREIVQQHTSFVPGDEEKLYELVKKVAAGQSISE